jgi:hypothetical protein
MPHDMTLGKWIAGVAATIVGAVLVWVLTHPGGLLNPKEPVQTAPTPTASTSPTPVGGSTLSPTPPHAPPIENIFGVPLFEEQQQLITIHAGQKVTLRGEELWSAPALTEVGCANGIIAYTWIVRDPYPKGGEDLQLLSIVPQGGGVTEKFAGGASGSRSMMYCSEIILFNTSLTTYRVEIRYASGVTE